MDNGGSVVTVWILIGRVVVGGSVPHKGRGYEGGAE